MNQYSAESGNRQLGDYANVDAADADNLVSRLDAMRLLEAFRTYKLETFRLLRLSAGASVADIGCGTGEDARQLAERAGPGGRAVGFDLSEAMLTQARERHAALPNLSFTAASVDALGAPDESFDAVRVDRVLIHVPDPAAALAEIVRVTKPGGRIVISEPDMPGCWAASDDNALTGRIMQAIAESCSAPYLARDLWGMFHDAGLAEVELDVRTVTAFDPQSVGKILDFATVVSTMLATSRLTPEEAARWSHEFEARGRNHRFVAGLNIMIVSGTKPK